jgi:hypothetical protein
MAALMEAIKFIYVHPGWNERIFSILSQKILKGKKAHREVWDDPLGDICAWPGRVHEHLL